MLAVKKVNKQTVDLRLPNSIGSTPKCGNKEEDPSHIWTRCPLEEDHDANDINKCTGDENRHSANVIDQASETKGAKCIHSSVGNEDITEVVNTPGTRHISL
jgi:hypothetical protein